MIESVSADMKHFEVAIFYKGLSRFGSFSQTLMIVGIVEIRNVRNEGNAKNKFRAVRVVRGLGVLQISCNVTTCKVCHTREQTRRPEVNGKVNRRSAAMSGLAPIVAGVCTRM